VAAARSVAAAAGGVKESTNRKYGERHRSNENQREMKKNQYRNIIIEA
jgi:hypothetical protein